MDLDNLDYSLRDAAWKKFGDDLSKGTGKAMTMCNWSTSQAGELLSIYLDRPACGHDKWNCYGFTKVGPKTALCKVLRDEPDCPAGLAVNDRMLRAQHRFGTENKKLMRSSDRPKAQSDLYAMESDEDRVNVYFAFLRSGAHPRRILPPLTVQEVSLLLSRSPLVRQRTQHISIASTCPK